MGRSKIKIEKREFKAERQKSFHVRHLGVLKKAYNLSVLCDVDVGLVYYSPTGVLHHFSTKSPNVAKVLQGLVGYLENASEEEKTRLRLAQDTINMINITAAQDDAAVQADQDAVRREVIKNKIRDLKLLQETKRMVCPHIETFYSSSEREKLERFLETRLSEIVKLKEKFGATSANQQEGQAASGFIKFL